MKSLKFQQSPVKNQGQTSLCILYSTASCVEEATIKAGKLITIDPEEMYRAASKIVLQWETGLKYGYGTVDSALTWAKDKGYIDGYKWIEKQDIKKYIDMGYSVIASLNGYPMSGRDMYHNILFTGYDDNGYEYKNSWGTAWGDGGYGYVTNADVEKYTPNPCYIVYPKNSPKDVSPEVPAPTTEAVKTVLMKPVDAPITQFYGENIAYYNTAALGFTRGHPGIDFGCPIGTPVRCAADGVLLANRTIAGALVMTVQHTFGTTEYWHLSKTVGMPGDRVKQGQIICWSGNSGQFVIGNGHLHFEYHPIVGADAHMNGAANPLPLFTAPIPAPVVLKETDIIAGLQKVLIAPIPPFNWMFGLGYPGGRANWALAHRRNIYNLYIKYLNRIPTPTEVDGWLVVSSNIAIIEKGILGSVEYSSKK